MLPIEVKIVSSASCTLSAASALLRGFLSSEACSDSFARDYVAHVAQALQDTISRRSGGPEPRSEHGTRLHFPTPSESPSRSRNKRFDVKQSIAIAGNSTASPPHNKLRGHGRENSLDTNKLVSCDRGDDEKSRANDIGQDADVCMFKGEHAFGMPKKNRRHSAIEMTSQTSLMYCEKKRRKKQKHETETEEISPDDQNHHDRNKSKEKREIETEKVIEYPVLNNQSKAKRKKENQGNDALDMETLHVSENRGSQVSMLQATRKVDVSRMDANNASMSAKVDDFAGSSKRKQKVVKESHSATPLKDLSVEEKGEEMDMKASALEFQNLASEEKKMTKKKRRRKEELGELVRQSHIDGDVDF